MKLSKFIILFFFVLSCAASLAQEKLDIMYSANMVIYGAGEQDKLGRWMSSGGDINNDGIEDLLLGIDGNFESPYINSAYIIYGSTDLPASIDLLNATSGLTRFRNIVGEATVSGIGDFNADGYDDFIIGNRNKDINGNIYAGDARIVFGSAELPVDLDYDALTVPSVFIKGYRSRAGLGSSISNVGDVNADGFNDALVSAYGRTGSQPGEVFLIYGGTDIPSLLQTPDISPYGVRFEGAIPEDFLGRVVSGPGDVNGDNLPDMLFAANAATEGITDHAYLIYGATDLPSEIKVSELGNLGVDFFNPKLIGSGRNVSSVGDFDNDGINDFLISELGALFDGVRMGRVVLLFGRDDFPVQLNLNQIEKYGVYINGVQENQQIGSVLGRVGDINMDGMDDLLIGTTSIHTEAPYLLIYNQTCLLEVNQKPVNSLDRILVNGENLSAGSQPGNIGDINRDGFDDYAFGDPSARPFDRFSAGTVYVIFGRPGLFESLLQKSDLNDDGVVDNKDLFLFQEQWQTTEQ